MPNDAVEPPAVEPWYQRIRWWRVLFALVALALVGWGVHRLTAPRTLAVEHQVGIPLAFGHMGCSQRAHGDGDRDSRPDQRLRLRRSPRGSRKLVGTRTRSTRRESGHSQSR